MNEVTGKKKTKLGVSEKSWPMSPRRIISSKFIAGEDENLTLSLCEFFSRVCPRKVKTTNYLTKIRRGTTIE